LKRLKWALEALLFIFLTLPLAVLPYRLSLKAGRALGLLIHRLWLSRGRVARQNVADSIRAGALDSGLSPERIVRECFAGLGATFAEAAKILYGLDRPVIESYEVRGAENYHAARAAGRGIIVIAGHCGNWELAALGPVFGYGPTAAVARAQNNPYLHRLVETIRVKHGNSVIYKKGALRDSLRTLRNNGMVAVLVDQASSKDEGCLVNFMGRRAWTTKLPALLARRTGAAALPILHCREGAKNIAIIYPEVKPSDNADIEQAIREDTQNFTSIIESHIRLHPEQWLWLHKRWKRAEV
jgi:KDO2-lipid IV(A) lauroyltransferase